MERKFGYYIVAGPLLGSVVGAFLGAVNGNAIVGIALGALAGVFLGWFVAAAVFENQNKSNKTPK